MSDDRPLSVELLAYRLTQVETVQRAIQVELYDLREERGQYVKRTELQRTAAIRREWPLILAGLVVAATSLGGFVLQLVH